MFRLLVLGGKLLWVEVKGLGFKEVHGLGFRV